jgi:hypothetical protein
MDGSYYKGQWNRGVQAGRGEIYKVGSRVKNGIFEKNKLIVDFT